MKIGSKDTQNATYIIAEIGNNHEGNFELACEMIGLAAEAGADAVKFQSIVPDRLVSARNKKRVKQLTRFQFSPEQFADLAGLADKHGVAFMSTPFDLAAVDYLDPLVPAFKIASGDNDFWPLIDRVVHTGKPLIISMGLGQSNNARRVIDFISASAVKHGLQIPDLALLHCVTSYPTPLEEAGLSGISTLARYGVTVGYSDHTLGIRAAELAVAAGARVIEKHFTIDKNHSAFHDHQISSDPTELKELVKSIRIIETMFVLSRTGCQDCEAGNEEAFRRSIAAARDLTAGHQVEWEDFCWVRPQTGLKPGQEDQVIGRVLTKPIGGGEHFTVTHFN